jgi:Ferritin-like domain
VSGAAERVEAAPGRTRRALLRTALAGAGAALATPVAGAPAARAGGGFSANDIAILRFDLVLEDLQAALYTEAERIGTLSPRTLACARVVGAHERAHARAIRALLGPAAVPSPSFDFRGVTEREDRFLRTAVAFEDLTAALLKWQAVRLDSRAVVAAVATLHSVETRHAAWIRHLVGIPPVTSAFDHPAPQIKMADLVRRTGFIVSGPRTGRRGRPRFTG